MIESKTDTPKLGRPLRVAEGVRARTLKCSDAEWAAIMGVAAATGSTASDIIRECVGLAGTAASRSRVSGLVAESFRRGKAGAK